MNGAGAVLLGMIAYIAGVGAKVVLEVPATLKLVQEVRIEVEHDVQQFLIMLGTIFILAT